MGDQKLLFRARVRPTSRHAERHIVYDFAGPVGWPSLYPSAKPISLGTAGARKIALAEIRALLLCIRQRDMKVLRHLMWMREAERHAPSRVYRALSSAFQTNWGGALRRFGYLYACPADQIKVRAFRRGILVWASERMPGDRRLNTEAAIVKLFKARPKNGTAFKDYSDMIVSVLRTASTLLFPDLDNRRA